VEIIPQKIGSLNFQLDLKFLPEKYRRDLEAAKIEISKTAHLQTFKEIAFQVSHDIRSPLSALNLVVGLMNQAPEQQRTLIRSAVNRINDIANDLLTKGKQIDKINTLELTVKTNEKPVLQPELLSALIENLISEKRVHYRDKQNIEIEADITNGGSVNI
jgi:signal transduction histidine kinase